MKSCDICKCNLNTQSINNYLHTKKRCFLHMFSYVKLVTPIFSVRTDYKTNLETYMLHGHVIVCYQLWMECGALTLKQNNKIKTLKFCLCILRYM